MIYKLSPTGERRVPDIGEWIATNSGPFRCLNKWETAYQILKLEVFENDPMEIIKAKLENITCLAAEGPEITPHTKLFEIICKEALEGLRAMERK